MPNYADFVDIYDFLCRLIAGLSPAGRVLLKDYFFCLKISQPDINRANNHRLEQKENTIAAEVRKFDRIFVPFTYPRHDDIGGGAY